MVAQVDLEYVEAAAKAAKAAGVPHFSLVSAGKSTFTVMLLNWRA